MKDILMVDLCSDNMKSSWQFAALAVGVAALCVFGSADGAYGLEFVSADLHTGTQILTVVFDEDVDPDSVDASKFYLGARDSVFGRVALTGADIDVSGATVSFTLDTLPSMHAVELIFSPRLTIGATAVADSAGDPFGIRLEFVDDTALRSSFSRTDVIRHKAWISTAMEPACSLGMRITSANTTCSLPLTYPPPLTDSPGRP